MQVERRTVTRVRHEYHLPSPCSAVDLLSMQNWATSDLYTAGQDRLAYSVEARGDEIVIWWEEAETDG